MLAPELEKRIRSIIDAFRSDQFGIHHATRLLEWEIDQDNVKDVMNIVPPDVREALETDVAEMPRDDAQWEQWIDLYTEQAEFYPWTPIEEIVQWKQNAKRDTRRAIEALRNYFEKGRA